MEPVRSMQTQQMVSRNWEVKATPKPLNTAYLKTSNQFFPLLNNLLLNQVLVAFVTLSNIVVMMREIKVFSTLLLLILIAFYLTHARKGKRVQIQFINSIKV